MAIIVSAMIPRDKKRKMGFYARIIAQDGRVQIEICAIAIAWMKNVRGERLEKEIFG